MTTEQLSGRSLFIEFDADEEERFTYPWAPDVDYNKRTEIDTDNMTSTEVNTKMRELMNEGYGTIVIKNPRGKHSLSVGILNRLNLIIEGSLGYFAVGLIDGPNVRINGRVGWSCAENMMSGTVVIEKNAGSTFGAAIRGGDLVCRGSVGSRTGIDMKGGTIIVGGDTGMLSGFMMQRGRMVVCGNAGKSLGDSMYDGAIYVGGEIKSLGVDAVPAEITDLDRAWLTRKLKQYELLPKKGVDQFTKIVAGKQLWNYDNLEPTEKTVPEKVKPGTAPHVDHGKRPPFRRRGHRAQRGQEERTAANLVGLGHAHFEDRDQRLALSENEGAKAREGCRRGLHRVRRGRDRAVEARERIVRPLEEQHVDGGEERVRHRFARDLRCNREKFRIVRDPRCERCIEDAAVLASLGREALEAFSQRRHASPGVVRHCRTHSIATHHPRPRRRTSKRVARDQLVGQHLRYWSITMSGQLLHEQTEARTFNKLTNDRQRRRYL